MSDGIRFYMTYARSRPSTIVPWVEENNVPLLTNAVHRWSFNTDSFLPMFEYDTPHVIDAGGFNVQAKWIKEHNTNEKSITSQNLGDADIPDSVLRKERETDAPFYPWDVSQYHDWLCEHSEEMDWACVMDYACEDRFNPIWDVQSRREATLSRTIEQFDLLDTRNPEYKLLPVLQGRSVDEYVEFYEWLEDHGIPTDHVGLGTVCRISSEKKIVDVEQRVRERTGVDRLHGFGVKIDAFKHGAGFESADSQAWVYAPSNGRCYIDDVDRLRQIDMPDHSLERTFESFRSYYSYVTRLQQGTSAIDYDTEITASTLDSVASAVIQNKV